MASSLTGSLVSGLAASSSSVAARLSPGSMGLFGRWKRISQDIRIHFYPSENKADGNWADLILPFSRDLSLNDGLWFEVENSTDHQTKEFAIPSNVYKAVLEVYVSFHEDDETWYSNLPNDYIAANNLSGAQEMGHLGRLL
ncbi:hypothetical protein V2J09_009125 [Rumex salicifolius]